MSFTNEIYKRVVFYKPRRNPIRVQTGADPPRFLAPPWRRSSIRSTWCQRSKAHRRHKSRLTRPGRARRCRDGASRPRPVLLTANRRWRRKMPASRIRKRGRAHFFGRPGATRMLAMYSENEARLKVQRHRSVGFGYFHVIVEKISRQP
jgi:hypothetical protein